MIPNNYRILSAGLLSMAITSSGISQTKSGETRDLSQGNTLYVVPYAHLDTQWRWAYPQVIREFIPNTLNRNFALIEKYPHYVFNFSGSRRYEMMKEYYPDEFEKLRGYVKAGRWFPAGSSVDEGDANVPSAESLVRHVLYGNHFFQKEFGVASHEFMLPDCFGFPYALPTILAHCGVKGFSTQKLTWGSAVGIPFKVGVWEGPDGRSVVAALDPGSYGADVSEDLSQNTSWLARIQNTGKQSGAYVDYHYYGTGDTGGAPREPSVEWVEKSIAGSGPISVVSSKSDAMFDALTPDQIGKLPRYKGELLLTQHSAGSISSQAMMKRWNRKSELLADGAEKASVAAMILASTHYPADRLYHAWDLVLGSQMHDMLPGTSIPKAYEFCWNDYLLAQNQFAAVETDAIGAIAKEMDTRGDGTPLVVYNPLSIPRKDLVEATVALPNQTGLAPDDTIEVTGPTGEVAPSQILSKSGGSVKIVFPATVAPTGFTVYSARVKRAERVGSDMRVDLQGLENRRFRVTLNDAGDIASIWDKKNQREVLKAPSRLELQYHNPGAYPAWNMDWEDAKLPPSEVVGGPAKVHIVENGPVRVALQVEREAKGSKFVQTIRLGADSESVEVACKVDWKTRERALKASFPLTSGSPDATYDLQVGTTVRGNNNEKKYEVPQHQWLDLTKPDGSFGAGILSESKYGSDKPNDDTVRLTLIYTPGVRAGFEDQATQDFGRHEFSYAIAPHDGDWQKGNVPWLAQRFNQPLRVFRTTSHEGQLGKRFSFLSTSSAQVAVQALKKAEDGSGIIVRLRELMGANANGVKLRFSAPVISAKEVDGQETMLGKAVVRDGELIADVPAYSLKSYMITLAPPQIKPNSTASITVPLSYDSDVVSNRVNPGDGAFAGDRSIPADQLPERLAVDDVQFSFGPKTDGAKNAVTARGQTLDLPAGYDHVYLLAAASEDLGADFQVGDMSVNQIIRKWDGYVGQWDNRTWSVDPGPNFSNYGDTMNGLDPGWVKSGEVAWFSSHCHTPHGNTYYEYCYLFKYGFDIPKGAHTLTLPNDPRIKVLAVSVARGGHDSATPASPLYDNLMGRNSEGAPTISPAAGSFNDVTTVTIQPPLYYHAGNIRYTLDGSDPTATSALYSGPFLLNDPAIVKVAQIDAQGHVGPIATADIQVRDTTPPSIVSAAMVGELGLAKIVFSEPVTQASAEDVTHYKFASQAKVTGAHLAGDGMTVELTLDPVAAGVTDRLTVSGVKDMAKTPNVSFSTVDVAPHSAVFTSPPLEPKVARAFNSIKGLPVRGTDAWTLNLFCRVEQQPDDRTIIGGFGRSIDGRIGTGRYFTKFPEGLNFWIADRDVMTRTQLDIGKWQMLTAAYDGTTMRLYKNGDLIAEQKVKLEDDASQVRVMPLDAWDRVRRFDGSVRDLAVWDLDLPPAAVKRLWLASQSRG